MADDEAAGFGSAQAVVEERQLLKAMSWWDGFMVALANPGFLVAALGGSIVGLGTLGAVIIWTISVVLGMFQNSIYAELATMFPTKSGGISLFAHEAWRKYFSPVGALATFGYWFAWSTVLSISGLIAGTLIQTQFFSKVNFHLTGGHFHLDLPTLIGVVFVCLVWFFGARGIRSSVWFSYVTGILLMIPLFVMMFLPYVTGAWHSSDLQWNVGSGFNGFALVVTWLYFMGWSSYGFESVAAFAPEYRNTRSDTPRALYASAAFSVFVYALLPLGLGGTLSTQQVASDPTEIAFYATALDKIVGHTAGSVLVICMVFGIVLTMETATMDGSRALYGIAKDGMTIKWLAHLNKHHVPGRGMMVDGVLNIFLIVFFGSAIQIIAAGNLGYMLSHFFALVGFLLLRKDRPNWPRPIKRSAIWLPIAGILALANLMFVVLGGFVFANQYGYGLSKTWVGVGVLCVSIILYFYRKVVQDRQPLGLRQEVPQYPSREEEAAFAAEGAGA